MRTSTGTVRVRVAAAALLALFAWLVAPPRATSESAKVGEFLRLVQKAKSLDEISVAFERAGFSQAEIREVETAVGRPPYAAKLKSLSGPLTKSVPSGPKVTGKRIVVDTAKKRVINDRATALARTLKTGPSTAVRSVKTAAQPLSAARPAAARTPLPGGGVSGRITGLNADPIRVGDRLTITGSGFGTRRGTVELVTPESRYICDLVSWSDTRLEATVPAYMDHVVGDRGLALRLRIMLPGDSLGPYRDIRLQPSIREPEVVSLSSQEIMPGNEVAIEGRWFYGRGTVEFDFGSQLFRGTIREWTDSLITAGIPDGIGGLQRTVGQIIMRNDQGREARHPITFEPDKEMVTLTMTRELDRSTKATGDVKTLYYFENFEMKPGWLVRSYSKEIVSGRGRARYNLEPDPGTTRILNIITLDAPSFTCLRVASHVTIIGPKGTPYW